MPSTTAPPLAPVLLAIETSCDDTACAVIDGEGRVLASVVSRQLAAHRPFGGVVPEIASREHLKNWPPVFAETLRKAGLELDDLDAIAATRGPGLVGALLVGLSLGKSLAYGLGKPFHAVHHLEGHLYSPYLPAPTDDAPAAADSAPESFVGLVVSGGHSNLYAVETGRVETLGQSRDDAMGEVFDKVGKRLGLPYPQGPWVDRLAEIEDPAGSDNPAGPGGFGVSALPGYDVSFSGLKSQALNAIQKLERAGIDTDLSGLGPEDPAPPEVGRLLAEFRAAAVAQILGRLDVLHAARRHGESPVRHLAVSGGAAANRRLRRDLEGWAAAHDVELRLVPLAYSGDNAAMIAHAALLRHRRGESDDPFEAEAQSRLEIA